MSIGYVLYNSKAGVKEDIEDIRLLEIVLDYNLKFIDIVNIRDYRVFLSGLDNDDVIIIAGGDGTLNRFVNDTAEIEYHNEVLYYPNGTGNDFARDLNYSKGCIPFPINEYIRNLPVVTVNGRKYHFINGVGFGIDGYCCEVGDEIKKMSEKKVNYTSIAIKGLLFHYKPTNAKITVDGRTYTYEKVWLAPTMIGRYYGDGMMPAPNQNRTNSDGTLTAMIFHRAGKLRTLLAFPSIFKGEHIRKKRMVKNLTGHEITVEFDRPTPLQIDGETISGVTSYTALSPARIKEINSDEEMRAKIR